MKDGGHGFPVYFLGALVIQANMAKVPGTASNGLLVPTVGKGAALFWRRHMVEWRGAAGHCWAIGLDSASSWSWTRTLHILLHASLLHAEGDLWVLVVEHDVCNTRSWIAGV